MKTKLLNFKLLSLLVALFMCCAFFVGCGPEDSSENNNQNNTNAITTQQATLAINTTVTELKTPISVLNVSTLDTSTTAYNEVSSWGYPADDNITQLTNFMLIATELMNNSKLSLGSTFTEYNLTVTSMDFFVRMRVYEAQNNIICMDALFSDDYTNPSLYQTVICKIGYDFTSNKLTSFEINFIMCNSVSEGVKDCYSCKLLDNHKYVFNKSATGANEVSAVKIAEAEAMLLEDATSANFDMTAIHDRVIANSQAS